MFRYGGNVKRNLNNLSPEMVNTVLSLHPFKISYVTGKSC